MNSVGRRVMHSRTDVHTAALVAMDCGTLRAIEIIEPEPHVIVVVVRAGTDRTCAEARALVPVVREAIAGGLVAGIKLVVTWGYLWTARGNARIPLTLMPRDTLDDLFELVEREGIADASGRDLETRPVTAWRGAWAGHVYEEITRRLAEGEPEFTITPQTRIKP